MKELKNMRMREVYETVAGSDRLHIAFDFERQSPSPAGKRLIADYISSPLVRDFITHSSYDKLQSILQIALNTTEHVHLTPAAGDMMSAFVDVSSEETTYDKNAGHFVNITLLEKILGLQSEQVKKLISLTAKDTEQADDFTLKSLLIEYTDTKPLAVHCAVDSLLSDYTTEAGTCFKAVKVISLPSSVFESFEKKESIHALEHIVVTLLANTQNVDHNRQLQIFFAKKEGSSCVDVLCAVDSKKLESDFSQPHFDEIQGKMMEMIEFKLQCHDAVETSDCHLLSDEEVQALQDDMNSAAMAMDELLLRENNRTDSSYS